MLRLKEISNSHLNGRFRFINIKFIEFYSSVKAGYFRPDNTKYSYKDGIIIFENYECTIIPQIHAHTIFDHSFIINLIKTRASFPVNWITYPILTKKDIMDNYSLIEGMFPGQISDIIQRSDTIYKSYKERRGSRLPKFARSFEFQQKCFIMMNVVNFLKN